MLANKYEINKYLLKPLNFETVQIAFFIVNDVLLPKLETLVKKNALTFPGN